MGITRRCPYCKNGVDLGDGFGGPGYTDENGKPFDPFEKEECPECGRKVKKKEWGQFVMMWD